MTGGGLGARGKGVKAREHRAALQSKKTNDAPAGVYPAAHLKVYGEGSLPAFLATHMR